MNEGDLVAVHHTANKAMSYVALQSFFAKAAEGGLYLALNGYHSYAA